MSANEQTGSPRPRRTALLAIAVLAATFVVGVLAGIAADRTLMRRVWRDRPAQPSPSFLASRLEKRLDLTPDQKRQVEEILTRHHSRMNAAWNAARPAVRAEIEAANAEIDLLLTPEQREKFAQLKMRMRSRRSGQPPH